jgi:hypothetical protein
MVGLESLPQGFGVLNVLHDEMQAWDCPISTHQVGGSMQNCRVVFCRMEIVRCR